MAGLKSNYYGAMAAFNSAPRAARWGAIGAGAGGVYGATLGRDPGQSKLGGFMSGAMMGGAMGAGGHYGALGLRAARPQINALAGSFAAGNYRGMISGLGGVGRAGGRAAFGAMRSDGARASAFIGSGINKGYTKIRGLHR